MIHNSNTDYTSLKTGVVILASFLTPIKRTCLLRHTLGFLFYDPEQLMWN